MTISTADEFFKRRHGIWIDGQECHDYGGGELSVVDPATELAIARIGLGNAADIDRAVAAARAALHGPWSALSPDARQRILLRFAELIEANAATATDIAIHDGGLPFPVAASCAPVAAGFMRYYAGWPSKIAGQTLPSAALGKRPQDLLAYTLREPIGVVGAITPWNYPFGMEMLKIAPILACGCTLVLKPAEQAPLAALMLAELALEAGVPPGVFNVVTGVGEVAGAARSAHQQVDKLAFTGSTEVGKIIVRAAAGNLKKVSLELGGKSPVIVFPDADLETAIPGVAMATFLSSGQNCVCGSRVYVHEKIAKPLADGVAKFAAQMPLGPGSNHQNLIGPLISAEQRDRVEGFLQSALQEGAECIAGGKRGADRGYFIQPTVYTRCTPQMRVVEEEIFGPVMAIQTFAHQDLERIATEANRTNYGLSASIWTRDLAIAHRLTRMIDAGQVGVNCHAAMDPTMPFGGFKQSGWGSEFGAAALELYLRTKAVTITWS